jgi:hypothetical protein
VLGSTAQHTSRQRLIERWLVPDPSNGPKF